jgi:predicted transcriptional regulator
VVILNAMKVLSLKLDDAIFEETEQLTNQMKLARNRYINEAVSLYNQFNRKRLLKQQLQKESMLVKQQSMEVLNAFEQFMDEA